MLVVGCGGDDSATVDNEAGSDAGSDGAADGSKLDAHADGTVPDGSQNDASIDSPVTVDGSSDSALDSALEADAPEASVVSASEYRGAVAQAYCTRLSVCCEADAGDFDIAGCVAAFHGNPLLVGEATPYLDSGLLNFNTAQASACLTDLMNFPCGTVTAMQNVGLGQACIAAFSGAQSTGGACSDPIVCPSTDYCQLPGDGGVGTCTPLVGDGGTCTDTAQCSYLGNGVPPLYCNTVDGTCLPELDNGAICTSYAECQSQECTGPSPHTCAATYVFSDPNTPGGTCARFTLDAGGD
jgi:hypothetical protein